MLSLVLRRILISIPLLLIVSMSVFVLQSLIPGDPARSIAGLQASLEQVEQIRQQLHLDEPLWQQYWRWLSDLLFHGSLGVSISNQEPVINALAGRFPVTLALVLLATLLAIVVGIGLGVASSRGGLWARRLSDVVSILGMAVPAFWLALLLVSFFAIALSWFPASGYVPITDSVGGWAWSLALPVIALAFSGITSIAKVTREGMLDTMSRDFVRNLRANGVPEGLIVFKHALRSAALPVITIGGLIFVGSLSSSVVIEQIFGLGGLGGLAITSTFQKDIPVIQGVALCFTLMVIVVNLLIDLLYGWLDPRVRSSS